MGDNYSLCSLSDTWQETHISHTEYIHILTRWTSRLCELTNLRLRRSIQGFWRYRSIGSQRCVFTAYVVHVLVCAIVSRNWIGLLLFVFYLFCLFLLFFAVWGTAEIVHDPLIWPPDWAVMKHGPVVKLKWAAGKRLKTVSDGLSPKKGWLI